MEDIYKLICDRDEIENKISLFGEILENNAHVGMNGSLIDAQGYPRADIDVYQVRRARVEIIRLQNDHKDLMKKIESGIHFLHQNSTNDPNGMNARTPLEDLIAFALINRVDSGSPAETDGLHIDDEICKFGSITAENFVNLASIGDLVQNSKNKLIQVVVRRNSKEKSILLTPRTWFGRGLLGCNIIPLDNLDR